MTLVEASFPLDWSCFGRICACSKGLPEVGLVVSAVLSSFSRVPRLRYSTLLRVLVVAFVLFFWLNVLRLRAFRGLSFGFFGWAVRFCKWTLIAEARLFRHFPGRRTVFGVQVCDSSVLDTVCFISFLSVRTKVTKGSPRSPALAVPWPLNYPTDH